MGRMLRTVFCLCALLLSAAGCTTFVRPVGPDSGASDRSSCYIVFDAGSSGTRLFVYEKQDAKWREHAGPRVPALADPVREIRGKVRADIDRVTSEVVAALDEIRRPGPVGENGKPSWRAFDWTRRCHVDAAMVYATAGMRIAEQDHPAQSRVLWESLKQKLKGKMGASVAVDARTLTGFEEGLYAWLAVRQTTKTDRFGIAEMGGASTQIAFPCAGCDPADEASKPVLVEGRTVRIYSVSFLGLGQDEAPKSLGMPAACRYGIGAVQRNWTPSDCSGQIPLADGDEIRDPYDYGNARRGTRRHVPTERADADTWLLTGAFTYWDDRQVDRCCMARNQCYDAANSCFRTVYFDKFLQTLKIPATSEKSNASWTLGAAICSADNCLQQATPPACHWRAEGCL